MKAKTKRQKNIANLEKVVGALRKKKQLSAKEAAMLEYCENQLSALKAAEAAELKQKKDRQNKIVIGVSGAIAALVLVSCISNALSSDETELASDMRTDEAVVLENSGGDSVDAETADSLATLDAETVVSENQNETETETTAPEAQSNDTANAETVTETETATEETEVIIPVVLDESQDNTETEETTVFTEETETAAVAAPDDTPVETEAETEETHAPETEAKTARPAIGSTVTISLSSIPSYSGNPYTSVNNNVPYFTEDDYTTVSYEYYSDLDSLGRCGVCVASIGTDLMPTEERGSIGDVKPTGWHLEKYDNVDGKYLYNRCHLIGYQLSGENANTKNLITGTRYMNVQGMLPFENMVADYVKETGNHVLYRSTPVFDGNNLLASGVQLEGYSVEDNGSGICFNVFCYNVQPDISIDYATGDSTFVGIVQEEIPETEETTAQTEPAEETNPPSEQGVEVTYILNTSSKKFHYPTCSSVDDMKEKNKQSFTGTRDEAIAQGYVPCKRCNP